MRHIKDLELLFFTDNYIIQKAKRVGATSPDATTVRTQSLLLRKCAASGVKVMYQKYKVGKWCRIQVMLSMLSVGLTDSEEFDLREIFPLEAGALDFTYEMESISDYATFTMDAYRRHRTN